MLMTLAEENGIHFTALFRFQQNDWFHYDGMADPTYRSVADLSSIQQHVGWVVYAEIDVVKDQMKSLKVV